MRRREVEEPLPHYQQESREDLDIALETRMAKTIEVELELNILRR